MPIARLTRTRATVPAGYQFGDAGKTLSHRYDEDFTDRGFRIGETVKFCFPSWRPRHLNAAEQLARRGDWNVIEGEHYATDRASDETAPSGWRSWREYWTDRDPADEPPRTGVYSGPGDEA